MKISNEAKVGILIVTVLIILAALTFRTGDFNFANKGYNVKVLFSNIDGIKLNAPVMFNGLEVGKVEEITIVEQDNATKLELQVWLREDAKLREGTTAYVKNMGFLGEKYVGLSNGPISSGYLSQGAVIDGSDPVDLDGLLLDGQEIAGNIKDITENLKLRLEKNEEYIDNIFLNMDSITTNLDERLTKNRQKIDNFMTHLESSSVNLDQFTYDLKMNPWKLMYRPKEKRQKSIDMMDK